MTNRLGRLILMLVAACLLLGCSEEYKAKKADEARWKDVAAEDTVDAYAAFVEAYSESAYRDEALSRVNEIRGKQLRIEMQDTIGGCVPDVNDPELFDLLIASEETLVSIEALRNKYNWDDNLGKLWKWSDSLAGVEMTNGSTVFLAKGTVDPAVGVAYTMGFGGKGFGSLCIDNLQVSGTVTFAQEGLLLGEGAVLIYPR